MSRLSAPLHDTNLRRTVLVQEGVTVRHRSAEYPMRDVPGTAPLLHGPLSSPAVRHPTTAAVITDAALRAKSIHSETKANV